MTRCPDCHETIHTSDPSRSDAMDRVMFERRLATHRQWHCSKRKAVLSDGTRTR